MAASPGAPSPVAQQYTKWVYPKPIMDLSAPELQGIRDGGDPENNFYTYWPNQAYRDDLDILIAGCGSNAAARYAFNHPAARVVGIDISPASLAHEAYLKQKHALDNLTLHRLTLEEAQSLERPFDFIEVSGVVHHLPDPVAGLKALGSVLRPNGTIAIMVYGRYGRTGVYMLQELFRLLALEQTDQDLAVVKQAIAAVPKHHVIREYMSRARDLSYDAGLVDTFLHSQDRPFTVAECLDLVRQAGLSFMGWLDNIFYYPEGQIPPDRPLNARINALPEERIWSSMELFNSTLGQHYFCACRSTRPASTYKITFAGPEFMSYIPVLRSQRVASKAGVPEGCITIKRAPWPDYVLNPVISALFLQIDGHKSIADCFAGAKLALQYQRQREDVCRDAFRYLWRLGYIFLRIPA